MDRCVMREMAPAKKCSFFTPFFYSHRLSAQIYARLVKQTEIQKAPTEWGTNESKDEHLGKW